MTDAPKIESRTRDDDALPASAIQTELARIVASDAFRRSVRHCHFLRYVVDQRLGGRVGQLKEIEIAVAVFGRRQSAFDSRHDPIVRVEAGRVRERLAQFYALESADSTIEIGIPKGSYLPTFAARTPKEATGLQGTSIAVVPFVEICAPSSEQGLGDGLTDELIDALAQLPEVRVAARTSSYRLKHRTMDARAIGKALKVAHIIEGSMQHQGNRLRCIAHLVRTDDGFQVWSRRIEVDATDLFAAQAAIALAITDEVRRRIASGQPGTP
jgi:TolB-like protein